MKTNDEIKQGLEGLKFIANAGRIDDALALIQQLEAENTRKHEKIMQLYDTLEKETKIFQTIFEDLHKKLQQLRVERDAAVNQLETISGCLACKHAGTEPDESPCNECTFANGEAVESRWEWLGVQKKETNE